MSEEQTPAAFHDQKTSNQQNILSALLLRFAFLPIEGKFLLFFGHKSATAHVSRANEIWLTEKQFCAGFRICDKCKCPFITLSFNLMILHLCNWNKHNAKIKLKTYE